MPDYVSRAVRENLFSLPEHRIGKFSEDSFRPNENPFSYAIYGSRYLYKVIAEKFKPGVQYFPDGVVAFTDAKFTIDMQEERHTPYMGIEATELHELGHIENDRDSKPQDEAQINKDVAYKMGLPRFPFPSY